LTIKDESAKCPTRSKYHRRSSRKNREIAQHVLYRCLPNRYRTFQQHSSSAYRLDQGPSTIALQHLFNCVSTKCLGDHPGTDVAWQLFSSGLTALVRVKVRDETGNGIRYHSLDALLGLGVEPVPKTSHAGGVCGHVASVQPTTFSTGFPAPRIVYDKKVL